MLRTMFAFLIMTAIVMSIVSSQEKSCELRDIKTLSVILATTRNHLETMLDEKKKLVMEEVEQTKYKIIQQTTEIKTLDVSSLETATKIEDMFENLTVLIKTKNTEMKERLGEIMKNVTGVRTELDILLNITDGEWSLWSNWSACPVTCLGGLTRRTRTCDNRILSKLARGCEGNNEEVALCNSFMCSDIDDCIGHTCKNGATCVDGVYKYTCNCATGFTGRECDTDIDNCADKPCKNGATCVDGVANYLCICTTGFYGAACETPTYYGTSFVTGFMANYISSSVPALLFACSESTAVVTISIPALNIINEQHTLVGGFLNLTYPDTIVSKTSGKIENNGVFVTADKPVTLFSFHSAERSSDGSLVLPEQSLSNQYVISSYHTDAGTEEYLIIAAENETSVTIETGYLTQTIMLNRFETYVQAAANVSGTTIASSAPVYILSGHQCANIPSSTVPYCDYIEEAMPPKSSLGKVHIISFMRPRPDFSLNIVTAQSNTSLIIYDTYGNILESLGPFDRSQSMFRQYQKFMTISVVSNNPVLVTQYGHGSNRTGGDPSMMVIPDVSHYGRQYDFVVPEDFNENSTVTIVICEAYPSSGLLLNGQTFTAVQNVSVTIPNYGVYNVMYGNVSAGYNRMTHNATTDLKFGAWLYGYTIYEEYAWSLGYT